MKSISLKSIFHFILILAMALGQAACEGPEGPEGPPGPEGPQGPTGPAGPSSKAMVAEFRVDFTRNANGGYIVFLDLEQLQDIGIEITEADVIMLYMLVDVDMLDEETPLLYWAPMPQSFPYILNNETHNISYNYLHSYIDVGIYINSPIDLNLLTEAQQQEITQNNWFRLVIIPGEYLSGRIAKPKVDFNSYKEVAQYYNITEKDVKKIEIKKK